MPESQIIFWCIHSRNNRKGHVVTIRFEFVTNFLQIIKEEIGGRFKCYWFTFYKPLKMRAKIWPHIWLSGLSNYGRIFVWNRFDRLYVKKKSYFFVKHAFYRLHSIKYLFTVNSFLSSIHVAAPGFSGIPSPVLIPTLCGLLSGSRSLW